MIALEDEPSVVNCLFSLVKYVIDETIVKQRRAKETSKRLKMRALVLRMKTDSEITYEVQKRKLGVIQKTAVKTCHLKRSEN